MRSFFPSRTKLPIGVEVGTDGIRFVQVHGGRDGWSLIGAFESRSVPTDNEAVSELASSITEAVSAAAASSRFRGRHAVVALREGLVVSRTVRQPHLSPAERAKAVQLEGPSRLGLNDGCSAVVGSICAGQVGQGAESRDEVIYVGGLTQTLEAIVDGFRLGGLIVDAIEPTFVASARGAFPAWQREDTGTLDTIVHVGIEHTCVTLARDGDVTFHKSFDVGGNDMAEATAARLGVDISAAQDIRAQRLRCTWNPRERGSSDQKMDRAVFEATRPTMQQITQEVSLCLRHHGTSFRGARPERCILVGPGALEPRLGEIIQEATRTPTVVANPMRGVDMTAAVGAIERRMPQPQFVGAIGACLRATPVRAASLAESTEFESTGDQQDAIQNAVFGQEAA